MGSSRLKREKREVTSLFSQRHFQSELSTTFSFSCLSKSSSHVVTLTYLSHLVLFSSTNQKLEYSAKQNIIIKKKTIRNKKSQNNFEKNKKQNKTKRNQNIP